VPARPDADPGPWVPRPDAPMTSPPLFAPPHRMLDDHMAVIADSADSLFRAADLSLSRRPEVLSPASSASTALGIPAPVGAGLADPTSFSLLHVHLDPMDKSPALERLTSRLAKRV